MITMTADRHDPGPSLDAETLIHATGAEFREIVRRQGFDRSTAGLAEGYAQANVVIVPAIAAEEFAEFCGLNSRACPLIDRTTPGEPRSLKAASCADLRTDVPRYRVFRHGVAEREEPCSIEHLWQDDSVGFLLGCSFTFEHALLAAGLTLRHLEQHRNVSMYRTNRLCKPTGRFSGNMVVSMRPFAKEQIDRVVEISGRFPRMHGAPVHVGNPEELGIADLSQPDFGDAVDINEGEVPLFWACGVTPQVALLQAKLPLSITHSPGCMFVTDLRDEDFDEG